MNFLLTLFIFILMLGALIVLHELGHYLAALAVGVQVKEFGLGLPPRLHKLFTWRGTDFVLNWIPLGGYIRPAGEFDPLVSGSLAAASPWARIAVFAAGPLMNVVVGVLILTGAFMLGWPDVVQIDAVAPGSPAAAAGLQPGDQVLRMDGHAVHDPKDWATWMTAKLDQAVTLEIQRGAAQLTVTIIPSTAWSTNARPLGVVLSRAWVAYAPLPALGRALERLSLQVVETYSFLARLVTCQPQPEGARMSGLVGLLQITDKVVDKARSINSAQPLLNLTALISIALGLTNLLPFAALDGGRLAFALLEIIRRKPFNAQHEKFVHLAGLVALLGLMLFLIVQDVVYPIF